MSTNTKTICRNRHSDTGSDGSDEMELATFKGKWVQEYADRILRQFLRWQTPLGVARTYTGKLKEELSAFYDDPLKRLFIEATY